jgi:hypothetical protein
MRRIVGANAAELVPSVLSSDSSVMSAVLSGPVLVVCPETRGFVTYGGLTRALHDQR